MKKREDEITVRIAKNISVFRKNFALTQIKLASLLGVDPIHIGQCKSTRTNYTQPLPA